MPLRRIAASIALAVIVQPLAAQTVVDSTFTPRDTTGSYGNPSNWSHSEIPNNTPEKKYNVTVDLPVTVNIDAAISNLTISGRLSVVEHSFRIKEQTAARDFNVAIVSGPKNETILSAGSLSAFGKGVLTGHYDISADTPGADWATLQFDGARITTLSQGSLSLSGALTRVVDESGNNALSTLTHIKRDSSLTLAGHELIVAGPFTNNGSLSVLSGSTQPGRFSILGPLTNFDANSHTLFGGTYRIAAAEAPGPNEPTVFQFAKADIARNAATITIQGSQAKITDQNGNDAFRNFTHNTKFGTFNVSERDFSINGDFTNDGVLALWPRSFAPAAFTVNGSLTNFDPQTKTLTGGAYQLDGSFGAISFVFRGADIVYNAASISLNRDARISDENGKNGLRNFSHNLSAGQFTIRSFKDFTPPSDFTNEGVINIFGDPPTDVSQSSFKLTEGHRFQQTEGATYLESAVLTGDMLIKGGSLTTGGSNGVAASRSELTGDLIIGNASFDPRSLIVHGTVRLSPDSRFLTTPQDNGLESFRVTETCAVKGTLQIASQEFPPPSTATYPVVFTEGGIVGTFSNALNGTRVPTINGLGSFIVSYTPFNIVLSDYQAIPPAAELVNVSTRTNVLTGDNVVIGGFMVFGHDPKRVIIRGIGPSLTSSAVTGVLEDPTLELHDHTGTLIAANDNWRDKQTAEIKATGLAPSDNRESAIVMTLDPGTYTVVLAGKSSTTGIGLIEVYDLAKDSYSRLANISTRAFVDPQNVLVAGFIVGGSQLGDAQLVIRGIGPLLGGTGFLPDPTLELRDSEGSLIASNDDFNDAPENFKRISPSLRMINAQDSAIPANLSPGSYTALVRGKENASGVALVEVYDMNR